MTDKERIIIDGVDVSECDNFREGYCHPDTGVCFKCDTNCQHAAYYLKEQLARKTQECEKLKEKNALLESQMAFNLSEVEIKLGNEINRSETLLKELKRFDKIKDEFREMSEKLKTKNTHYRKALEEIDKVINNIFDRCLGHKTDGCTPVHNVCEELIKILDIISKVKGGEDERK